MSGRVRTALRAAVQIIGLILGLLALAWCVRKALDPENTSRLSRLQEAPGTSVGAILALSILTLVINGLIFWWTLRPIRRLRAADVLAVNALATFLNYLPFKLGALVRAAVHNRRDRVPLPVIGAWFFAVLALILSTIVPLAAVSAWRGVVDTLWFVAGAAGITGAAAATVAAARALRGEAGITRLERLRIFRLGPIRRVLRSRAWVSLHQGFDIVASVPTVAGVTLLRLADVAVQAARFLVAASILGQPLSVDQAVLVAAAFFLIGVISPTGMLGFREAGAAGLAGAMAYARTEEFAAVVLLVGATDAVVNLVGAAIGLAWLRPDRWLRAPTGASVATPGT